MTSLLANLTSISRAIGQERSEGTKKPDIVLDALKLLFSADAGSPSLSIVESSIIGMKDGSGDTSGSVLVQRALGATRELARLGAQGMPIDAEVLAAALVIEPVFCDRLSLAEVEERLGQEVSLLVHDAATVRRCPGRVDLYDAEASSALRELCLAFYDPRAVLMEFIFRLCSLRDADASAQHSDFQVSKFAAPLVPSAGCYP